MTPPSKETIKKRISKLRNQDISESLQALKSFSALTERSEFSALRAEPRFAETIPTITTARFLRQALILTQLQLRELTEKILSVSNPRATKWMLSI